MNNSTLITFLQARPTHEERLAKGKAVRQLVPRATLANLTMHNRGQIVVDVLRKQAASRIAELTPVRHARMMANPFAFFRGGAAIMAADLSKTPSPEITVQLCGDMHVSNFGFFSTTEHQLVFGINDFDETLPGNFDWDLKRLAASAMIAAEALGKDQTFGEHMVRNLCSSYRKHLAHYAQMPYLDLARAYIDQTQLIAAAKNVGPAAQRFLKKMVAKAQSHTNQGALGKLTIDTPTGRKLIDNPPLITHPELSDKGNRVHDLLNEGLETYLASLMPDRCRTLKKYQLVDAARKVVGVGSVGTSSWVLYLEGRDSADPLFLQSKQAQASVLAPYFPGHKYRCQGERVVIGQGLIQGAPDLFLGYGATREIDFYIRQLRDMKGGVSFGKDGISASVFPDYAKLCGWALANAHARSGDPAELAGYCGKGEQLDDALVAFAKSYCQQNQADYDTFLKAIKSGKLSCATENF